MGGIVPPTPKTSGVDRRYKSSRRAGKNRPSRVVGATQGKPPEGTSCAFMPSSSYQLAVRLFLTAGFDLTTRAILDTGSGPTLIDRRLLPVDTPLQPLDDLAKMFHDVNGGWLPIVGAVCLGVTPWGSDLLHLLWSCEQHECPSYCYPPKNGGCREKGSRADDTA